MQHQRGQLLPLLLLVGVASLVGVTKAVSVSYIGDVVVYQNETMWKCDHILCPDNTQRCHISKQKDPEDASIVLRENTCYGADNVILLQKITKDKVDPQQSISLNVDSYRNGVISSQSGGGNYFGGGGGGGISVNNYNSYGNVSPEVEREININLRNIEQQVQQNVAHIEEQVQENVNNINNGIQRQLADLQRNMQATFHNMFH